MPAAVGGRKPPPKRCPICGQRIWDPAVPTSLYETWRHYTEHVHAFHPEYERWNRRASFYYVLVSAIFVAALFAVIFAPIGLGPIILGIGVGVLLAGTGVVFSIKRIVKRRFRESWKMEHPGSPNPM